MDIPDDATIQELTNERNKRLFEVGITDPSLTLEQKCEAADEIARKMKEVRELQRRIDAMEAADDNRT